MSLSITRRYCCVAFCNNWQNCIKCRLKVLKNKQHERDLSSLSGTSFSALTMRLFLFLLLKSPFILQAVTDNMSVLGNSLEGV